MNSTPTLVYLHGVGDDGSRTGWLSDLHTALEPHVPADLPRFPFDLVAPDFSDLLHDDELPPPPPAPPRTPDPEVSSRQSARDYRLRQVDRAAVLAEYGSTPAADRWSSALARIPDVIDRIGERIVVGRLLPPVGRYLGEADRRGHILHRVRESIPARGDIVIIAHSLGGLVALDLLRFLPAGVRVRCLVTAASGLARDGLPEPLRPGRLRFPHHRVDTWLNVFNPRDPVTRGRGIGDRFPEALDIEVPSFPGDHQLTRLMRDPGLARVLAGCLTSSPGTAPRTEAPALPRPAAMELVRHRLRARIEESLSVLPDLDASALSLWRAARRQAEESPTSSDGSRAGGTATLTVQELPTRLPVGIIAEDDLGAALLTLLTCEPVSPGVCAIPDQVLARARMSVARDLGIPTQWVGTAGRVAAAAGCGRGHLDPAAHEAAEAELCRRVGLPAPR